MPGEEEGLVGEGDAGFCVLFANDGGVECGVCCIRGDVGGLDVALGRVGPDLSCLLGSDLGGMNGTGADAVTSRDEELPAPKKRLLKGRVVAPGRNILWNGGEEITDRMWNRGRNEGEETSTGRLRGGGRRARRGSGRAGEGRCEVAASALASGEARSVGLGLGLGLGLCLCLCLLLRRATAVVFHRGEAVKTGAERRLVPTSGVAGLLPRLAMLTLKERGSRKEKERRDGDVLFPSRGAAPTRPPHR